jgi:hypothetical protein
VRPYTTKGGSTIDLDAVQAVTRIEMSLGGFSSVILRVYAFVHGGRVLLDSSFLPGEMSCERIGYLGSIPPNDLDVDAARADLEATRIEFINAWTGKAQ